MIKGIIFDMDGLMFDSENLSYQCLIKIMEKYNVDFPIECFHQMMGATPADIKKVFLQYCDLSGYNVTFEELMEEYAAMMNSLVMEKGMPMKKGLLDLLDYAKEHHLKMAVASSSSRNVIAKYLKMNKISDYFEVCVGHEDITESKPSPQIFLKACADLGLKNEEVVVYEDSNRGLLAAQNAKMDNIWIPDLDQVEESTKTGISATYDDLKASIAYIKSKNS